MAALDTSVLVRYLVRDDLAQAEAAMRLVRRSRPLHIPITVVLELEWVLRSRFGFEKDTLVQTLTGLLESGDVSFAFESSVEWALRQYRKTSADFADCVHVALSQGTGETPWWTFDKAAATLKGAQLLTS